MAEHSPEPWEVNRFGSGVEDANGEMVILGLSGGDQESLDAADENDIRRIVACVNAFAGLPTEYIEQLGKPRCVNDSVSGKMTITFHGPSMRSKPGFVRGLEDD